MKAKSRVFGVLKWGVGVGALGTSYALFELPGLLIGLFVGAVVVTTRLKKKSPLGAIELEGAAIDFLSMKMREGEAEYALRRTDQGRWERRPVSVDAVSVAVARRMDSLSREQHAASFEKGQAMLKEVGEGRSDNRVPPQELAKIVRALPPGSEGRKALLETLIAFVREASGQEAADAALKGEEKMETLQALENWNAENEGFEPVPMFDGPIETAYQRYIHQG